MMKYDAVVGEIDELLGVERKSSRTSHQKGARVCMYRVHTLSKILAHVVMNINDCFHEV